MSMKVKIEIRQDLLDRVNKQLNGIQQIAMQSAVEQANELVNEIESRMATTKDHYGDYMTICNKPIDLMVFKIAGANANAIQAVKDIYGW